MLTFSSLAGVVEKEVVVGDWARRARLSHDEVNPARHPGRVDDEPELAHVRVDVQPVRPMRGGCGELRQNEVLHIAHSTRDTSHNQVRATRRGETIKTRQMGGRSLLLCVANTGPGGAGQNDVR